VANLSLIGINMGVILACARGILTANKRSIREIKDSRMSPVLPSWQNSLHILSNTGSETQRMWVGLKRENMTRTRPWYIVVLAEGLRINA